MKHQLIIVCALAVALALALPLHAQQSAKQLYQTGVYKEEVEGEQWGVIVIEQMFELIL